MMASVTGDEKVYCPYCRTVSNFNFPFNSRQYYRCPSCDLIFLRPKEGGAADVAYYRERYFDDYAEDQISGQRVNLYLHVLDLLDGYRKPGSLLDVGCGSGFFLKEARERGWNASGVDLSEKSIAYAKKLVGDTVLCGSLDDVPTDRSFEAITMINVLDHVDDPFGQLKKGKQPFGVGRHPLSSLPEWGITFFYDAFFPKTFIQAVHESFSCLS